MDGWQLLISGVSATGTVTAAVSALVIATKDRRDREAERQATDRAQARLVQIEVADSRADGRYGISVRNHGAQPILDLVIDRIELSDRPFRWNLAEGFTPRWQVARPEPDGLVRSVCGDFSNPDGTAMYGPVLNEHGITGMTTYPDKPDVSRIFVSITFTDANGNTWRTDTDRSLTRTGTVEPPARGWRKRLTQWFSRGV